MPSTTKNITMLQRTFAMDAVRRKYAIELSQICDIMGNLRWGKKCGTKTVEVTQNGFAINFATTLQRICDGTNFRY